MLDADALTVLAHDADLLKGRDPGTVVLTPHAGELARLLDVERSDVEAAGWSTSAGPLTLRRDGPAQGRHHAGRRPGAEPVRVNTTGAGWLGTAGAVTCSPGSAVRCWRQGSRPPRRRGRGVGARPGRSPGLRRGPVTASSVAAALPRVLGTLASPSSWGDHAGFAPFVLCMNALSTGEAGRVGGSAAMAGSTQAGSRRAAARVDLGAIRRQRRDAARRGAGRRS